MTFASRDAVQFSIYRTLAGFGPLKRVVGMFENLKGLSHEIDFKNFD
jgi:hypothetical protein